MILPLSSAAFCFQHILKSILQVKTENNLLRGHYTLLCACTEGTTKCRNEEMRNGNEEMRNGNEEMRLSLEKLVYTSHKLVPCMYGFL